MGVASSSEIPGGGTEGYHVLRVRSFLSFFDGTFFYLLAFSYKGLIDK